MFDLGEIHSSDRASDSQSVIFFSAIEIKSNTNTIYSYRVCPNYSFFIDRIQAAYCP